MKKRQLLTLLFVIVMIAEGRAQYDFLFPKRDVIQGGYDFWVYTPEDYYYSR